jgi:hypothetical protein
MLFQTQPGPDWSSKQSVCGPITKDEEEVVETLYSLAGMFTNNEEPKNDCKLGNASLDASRSTLQERSESDSPIIEGFFFFFFSFLHNFIIMLFFYAVL